MSYVEWAALALLGLFLVMAAVRLFKSPLRLVLRVGVNAVLGLAALWLLNLTSDFTGFSLGVNWFNALTVGILGVPGFCLLLLVKWVLV